MMYFRTVKTAVEALLTANAAGQFRVVGHQEDIQDTTELENLKRLVTVYFDQGQFPKAAGRTVGGGRHDMTFKINLTATAFNTTDMSVLDNPSSTQGQIAAALAAGLRASSEADRLIDELYDLVWNILKSPVNFDLGLGSGKVSNLWVDGFKKSDLLTRGEVVILSADFVLTLSATEIPPSVAPHAAPNTIVNTLNLTTNPAGTPLDTAQQGVKVG